MGNDHGCQLNPFFYLIQKHQRQSLIHKHTPKNGALDEYRNFQIYTIKVKYHEIHIHEEQRKQNKKRDPQHITFFLSQYQTKTNETNHLSPLPIYPC